MAVLQADDYLDLITTTQKNLGRFKWTSIITTLRKFVFFGELMNKSGIKVQQTGTHAQWNLQVTPVKNAKMTGLFAVEKVNTSDTMTTASVPFRHMFTGWATDERAIAMNSGDEQIVDLVKSLETAAMVDFAELVEDQGWNQPIDSADNEHLMGVPYYLVPDRTEGFNGLNPYGFTAGAGGVSSITYPNHANWTFSYNDLTPTDGIRAMRKAAENIDFETAPRAEHPTYNTGDRMGWYTVYAIRAKMEEVQESRNDNLKFDLAPMDNKTTFLGIPVIAVPKLEKLFATTAFVDATYASSGGFPYDGIYGINWGVFKIKVLKGEYMNRKGPKNGLEQQGRIIQTKMYTTMNLVCYDRRRCCVGTK